MGQGVPEGVVLVQPVRRRLLLNALVAVLVGALSFAAAAFSVLPDRIGGDLREHDDRVWRGGPWGAGPRLEPGDAADLPWLLLPVILLLVAALTARRLRPRAAFVGVVIAVAGYLALGFPYGPVLLAPALAVLSLASALPMRSWLPLAALLVPMLMAGYWSQPYLGLLDPGLYAGVVLGVAVSVVPAMFGLLRRSRRESDRLEREQELRQVAVEERLKMAREVHDVVGHSLSVISLQAGVALHVLKKRPDQVAASLEAIKRTSKDALLELRTTLEVYRDPASEGPRSPLPGLERLDDLVDALRAAGRTVSVVRQDHDHSPLPATVDQAAYRIVQEALTNVVRHANGAAAQVRLSREADRLLVEVIDNGPVVAAASYGEGNGIAGMSERARALGGSLTAHPLPAGGFAVRGTLPITDDAEVLS
jgi:signal transduction histidine kinase